MWYGYVKFTGTDHVTQDTACHVLRGSARVMTWGFGGGGTHRKHARMEKYKSVNDIHEIGPCLVSGHPREHVLEPRCWQRMRQFLWDHDGDFAAYVAAVKIK